MWVPLITPVFVQCVGTFEIELCVRRAAVMGEDASKHATLRGGHFVEHLLGEVKLVVVRGTLYLKIIT